METIVTTAPVEAVQTTPEATATTPVVTEPKWFDSIADEGLRGFVEQKQYKGIEDVIKANQSAIYAPGDDATPEQLSEFYNKLGRPETADKYGIKAPEGADPTFSKTAAEWFHKSGLSTKQATELTAQYNSFAQTQIAAQAEAQKAQYERDQTNALEKLQHSYGTDFAAAKELASRAMRFIAPDLDKNQSSETMSKIQQAVGAETFFNMFSKLGREFFAEHKFAGQSSSNPSPMTREEAQAAIEAKRNDKEWFIGWKAGDTEKVKEWKSLIAKAAGK